MKKTTPPLDSSRREFLGMAAAGVATGMSLAVLPAAGAPAATPAAAAVATGTQGYHETEHIRRYYQSAR